MYVRVLNCQSDQLKWTVMVAKFIVGYKFNKEDTEDKMTVEDFPCEHS